MFKNLMNIIADKVPGRETGTDAASGPSFQHQEEHSAEGFLCPLCMTAFPSAEILEEHYQKTHDDSNKHSSPSNSNGDLGTLRKEVLDLKSSLADERLSSEELKKEVLKMQADFQSKDEYDNASLMSQEREFDGAKNLLISEVTLLRQQLATELEQVNQLRKEKETLGSQLQKAKSEIDKKTEEIGSLQVQLSHRNTIDDASLLRQELVSVQRMMDEITREKENQLKELEIKLGEVQEQLKQNETNSDNKMKDMSSGYDLKLKEVKSEFDKIENELKSVRASFSIKEKQFTDELNSAKTEILGAKNFRVAAENECSDLKAEVQRLQEQHSELYNKIEGGEGAQAALDSFRKENETLNQNLSSSQTQNKELMKNIYNLKLEVDKIREEYASLSQLYKTAKEEWSTKHSLSMEQLKEKDEVVRQGKEKCESLQKSIEAKESQLKIVKTDLDESVQRIENLTKDLDSLRLVETELRGAASGLEAKIQIANASAKSSAEESNNLKAELSQFNLLQKEKNREAEETKQALKVAQATIRTLEQDVSRTRKLIEESEQNSKSQIKILQSKLVDSNDAISVTSKKLESSEKSYEEIKDKLENEMQLHEQIQRERREEIEELKKVVSETKAELYQSEAKVQQLQVQTDEVLTAKIESENKLKLSEEGKSLLLERCLSGASESERLQETINELRRRLEDSNSALQELGRENQSLQMENAKAQGRKWTDDAIVNTCTNTTCNREFTLTVRKHHCRHCGQIFCNECSSRTASVPSFKKPARVCDSCFDELTSK